MCIGNSQNLATWSQQVAQLGELASSRCVAEYTSVLVRINSSRRATHSTIEVAEVHGSHGSSIVLCRQETHPWKSSANVFKCTELPMRAFSPPIVCRDRPTRHMHTKIPTVPLVYSALHASACSRRPQIPVTGRFCKVWRHHVFDTKPEGYKSCLHTPASLERYHFHVCSMISCRGSRYRPNNVKVCKNHPTKERNEVIPIAS